MNGKEAAKLLGCSEKSVSRYVSTERPEAKRLHATRLPDGQLEITPEAIEDFKARMQPQPIQADPEGEGTGQTDKTPDKGALVPIRSIAVRPQQNNLTLETLAVAVVAIGQHLEAQGGQTRQDKPLESIADLAVMPFLTFAQAHRLFNIPEQYLRDAAKANEIKAVKVGRGRQVRADDVRDWHNKKFA